MDDSTDYQIDNGSHVQWEKAVSQQTDGLEEWDITAKQLPIHCNYGASNPYNAENDFK